MKYLALAACFTFLIAGLPVRAEGTDAKAVVVPFELLKSKHMAIRIKVNGKGPYRVIFDTGAPITLLNNKIARASGVVSKNASMPLFNLWGSMGPATIKTLEVGDLKAKNVAAVVMDHPTVEAISKVLGPIEGIVGFPFFARYKMTLDYQAKELTFVPNGYDPPDAMEALMETVMALVDDKPAKPKVLAPAGQWGLLLDKEEDDEESGVTINDVLPGSAAAAAGLKAGDRLLTLDGRWTDTLADTYQAAGRIKPGMTAKVHVKREGKEVELTVKPQPGL